MAKEEANPFLRTCDWTGEEFEGKGYILNTTDGTEMVSAAAFLAPWQPAPPVEDPFLVEDQAVKESAE